MQKSRKTIFYKTKHFNLKFWINREILLKNGTKSYQSAKKVQKFKIGFYTIWVFKRVICKAKSTKAFKNRWNNVILNQKSILLSVKLSVIHFANMLIQWILVFKIKKTINQPQICIQWKTTNHWITQGTKHIKVEPVRLVINS